MSVTSLHSAAEGGTGKPKNQRESENPRTDGSRKTQEPTGLGEPKNRPVGQPPTEKERWEWYSTPDQLAADPTGYGAVVVCLSLKRSLTKENDSESGTPVLGWSTTK